MNRISCVLCHHKGTLVDKAVDSILRSKRVEFEIIIMTSDQACIERLDGREKVTCVFAKGGPAGKRNMALKFAQYPLIAFFDDDIEVCPNTLWEMAEVLNRNEIGMVYGKLLNMEFRDRFDEAGSYLTWSGFLWARAESGIEDRGQFDQEELVLAGKSASCMIHRKVFAEVGMFDFSYEILGEETDLAWRVWLYGYKVVFVPQSITFHAFNTKFKPLDFYTPKRIYFNGCRNYISMLITNLGNNELVIPIVSQFVVWFSAGFCFFLTGKFEASINVFRGLGWVFCHLDHILSKRKKVQSERKVSDKELLPIIRKNPPFGYYWKRFFHYIKTGRHGG